MQLAQKLFQYVALGRLGGEQQFLRGHVLRVVILEDELQNDLARRLGAAALEHIVFRANEAAGADEEHLNDGVCLLGHHGDDVFVAFVRGDGLLALHDVLHGADAVAVDGGALIVHGLGGLSHALLEFREHGAVLAGEEFHGPCKHRVIFLAGGQARAGGEALADLVVDAGALGLFRANDAVAGANGKDHARHVQHLAHGGRALVGAEVARAVARLPAHQFQARVVLGKVDADVGKVLIVLEEYVVLGAIALDEVEFQRQRLHLAVDEDDVKIVHVLDHGLHLGGVVFAGLEVLAHAVFQVHRLAHVDDPALGLHQVAARRIGQVFQLQGKFFRTHALPPYPTT